jgi:hypothetical protein
MVYMDCTLNNFMHFYVHPEQPLVHADKFDVSHDPLKVFPVPVLVHGVHGGYDVYGLHPEHIHALLSASSTTYSSC